jgi:hypothetical protein
MTTELHMNAEMEDEMHKFLKFLEQFHVTLPCMQKF